MGSDTSGVLQSDVPISLGVDEPITGKGGLKSGGLQSCSLRYMKWSFCGRFSTNATGLIPKQDLLLPLISGGEGGWGGGGGGWQRGREPSLYDRPS